jgi:hypothetical protein
VWVVYDKKVGKGIYVNRRYQVAKQWEIRTMFLLATQNSGAVDVPLSVGLSRIIVEVVKNENNG